LCYCYIIQIERLGLANRLRTIADTHQIAVLTNRILLVSWVPTAECNISFLDLFEDGPSHNFKVLPEPLPLKGGAKAVQEMAAAAGLSFITMDESFDFFVNPDVFESNVNIVYPLFVGVVALKGMPCQYYMTQHSRFYNALVPVKAVRDVVKEVLEIFDKK
jgi:hypothetical protein